MLLSLAAMALAGCDPMQDQPRFEPHEATSFFEDGSSTRRPVEGTVARGQLRLDDHLEKGMDQGRLASSFPLPVTRDFIQRGQERFRAFCVACHGQLGQGDGMVVRRGFPVPRTFHSDRLRQVPVGHFFNVISNGVGRMPPHGKQIPPRDRWAIAAYIRALQRSQHATLDDVPAAERSRLSPP